MTYGDVPRSEEELSVEVRLFDRVHVSDGDQSSRPGRDSHQRPVLQHLAADGAGSHLQQQKIFSKNTGMTIRN